MLDDRAGNRFDAIMGTYGVVYFASSLKGCYLETLCSFRLDPSLPQDLVDSWREMGFMRPGDVPRDWRTRRTAVRVRVDHNGPGFVDLEDHGTRKAIWADIGNMVRQLPPGNHRDRLALDVDLIRGPDRRVTRLISYWVYAQVDEQLNSHRYAGIRYLSKVESEHECWAVFDDADFVELERRPILEHDPDLCEVSQMYDIKVH